MKVLIVTLIVVIADQATKLYVKGIKIPFLGIDTPGMPYQSSKNVIGNFFKITFIENPGMAFGLQLGGKLFLSIFTIFATVLLVFFLYKNRNETLTLRLSLAFILGGAIGNLIDRVFYGVIYDYAPLFYGRVVDFLHFDFPNFSVFGKTFYSWPIFNIADVFVTIGFLIILIGYKKIFKHDELEEELIAEGISDTNDIPESPYNRSELINSDDNKIDNFEQRVDTKTEENEIPPVVTAELNDTDDKISEISKKTSGLNSNNDKPIPDVN